MGDEDNLSLTSFRPLSPDDSKSSFSLARFFQRKRPQARVEVKVNSPKSYRKAGPIGSPRTLPHHQQRAKSPEMHKSWSSPLLSRRTSPPYSASVNVGGRYATPGYRNLSAVLGRLSVAADRRGQLRQEYKESNFKQYWMPDENCKECYECGEKFNTFRRRHHCRLCGQIFCYRCCYMEIPGKLMGYTGFLRVCTYCHKVVKMYTQSSDLTTVRNIEQPAADLRTNSPDSEISPSSSCANLTLPKTYPFDFDEEENFYLQSSMRKISSGSAAVPSVLYEKLEQKDRPAPLVGRLPFDAFGVCAAEADMLKQDSYRGLWHNISSPRSGLELQSHRFRLKTYQNCLVGSELVDWLLTYEKASTRNQAVIIGQGLLDYYWLEPVPNAREGGAVFKDEYILYQPGVIAVREASATKKGSSLFWSDTDKTLETNEEESDEGNGDDDNDDDNDDMVPHWFRQLEQYGIEPGSEERDSSHENAGKVNGMKATGPKLLDLDLMNGLTSEEGDSEMSLKVDLQHFGEPGKFGTISADPHSETRGSKLSLITDAPPPPLEQYVYTEGYPYTPLRPSNKKTNEGGTVLSTSNTTDEIFSGAMIARKIGVDRPASPELSQLREDNGERLAMERLRAAHTYHLSTLLEQLLKDAGLSVDWRETMLPLVKIVSEQVTPDVRREDDMDICQYVKFKKIPGGSKNDCEMISGVVFTKNIANKKMASALNNPKILVLSCAIDYQRNENRLASLDPLVLQEFEFLKNFVARVVSLRPNILLVEKTVSRLAQDMLLQHGITVVLNVKPEVIERIARCTRADVLRSMEQLSRPQLGSCQSFRVHRYFLKNGESKTLMFIEGCPPDLGCTVNLRGGNSFVLAKVKRVFQHMVYVAYSLRLELHFLMDEFAMPPDPEHMFMERNTRHQNDCEEKTVAADAASEQETTEVDFTQVFCPALKDTILSSSPFLDFPLPYLLTEAGKNCAVRSALPQNIYWSARMDPELNSHLLTEQDLEKFDFTNPCQRRISKGVCVLQPHPFTSASLTMEWSDRVFQALLSDFRAQGGQIHATRNGAAISRGRSKWLDGAVENTSVRGVKKEENSFHGDCGSSQCASEETNGEVQEKKQVFPSSLTQFNRKVDCLDPYNHQRIAVLFSSYSSESNNSPRPCISPWAVFMEFYRRNDITLGGFLEIYCFRPSYICPNPNCDVPMVDHVRYFAHGTGSVYIHMRNLESPIPGFQHTILTWSWCKECKQVTPIVPLSPEAWALSFAKYLELRFYAGSYERRASVEPCGHSLHKDHYQYFAYANMVASFKYRSIKLFETVIPPPLISIEEKTRDASYWINDLGAMATRGDTVFAAFCDRLESLKAYSSQFDREAKIQQFVMALHEEHERFFEQVQIVEKKAVSLQGQQNPLAMEDADPCDQLGPEDRQALEYVIADSLNSLKKTLCQAVDSWNSRLQEFVQAEKKKNIKSLTTSPKEGKSPSPGQVDGKSPAETQLLKSSDVLSPPGQDSVNPSPAISPSLTPWGSRAASPNPPLHTNKDSPEPLTSADVEVSQTTCVFRPIPYLDRDTCTPADSPTDGILPVGGVVKGHVIPGTAGVSARKGPLPRVTLEKGPTELEATQGSLQGFVVVAPSGAEHRNGSLVSRREQPQRVDIKEVNTTVMEGGNDSERSKEAKEPCQGDMVGTKEPSDGNVEETKQPSEHDIARTKEASEGNRVHMEDTQEPPGVNTAKTQESSGVNMEGVKEHSGVNMEERKAPPEGNKERTQAPSRDTEKGERNVLVDHVEGTRKLSEGSVGTVLLKENNEAISSQSPLHRSEETKVEETLNKGTICTTEETADKDIGHQKLFTLGHQIEGTAKREGYIEKLFIPGHRRVASSPPNITTSLDDYKSWTGGEDAVPVPSLERCRSDSDLSVQAKHNLDVSMISVESNPEQLNSEHDYSMETDGNNESGKEESLEDKQADNRGQTSFGFRKVKTVPKSLHKRALASEVGESDATASTDGTTGISKREKVKHIISSFMSGPAFQPVASTFPNHEHHLLPPGDKVLVVVSEKETSSIIAYTLSTKEYNERLHEIQQSLCDIKNGTALEQQLLSKSEVSRTVDPSLKAFSMELPLGTDKLIRINSKDSQEDYVHLDLVDPDTPNRVEQEPETKSMLSVNLEFMENSQEFRKEPDPPDPPQSSSNSKADKAKYSKVKYSKVKQTGGKDESRKGETAGLQDSQVQDNPGLVEFGFQRKDANPPVDFHVKHQFSDNTCRFYCSIYYAEQFRNLRKRIFPDGEEKYIRSLQHSVAWGARGGKSGSAFFKSLDDRFVMKQMSKLELQSFLEFAPHYFRYINKALDDQRPTLLAKILGIYRIGYKNSQTSATMRQDVLVMENLFYDRKIDKTFDLKGSMRGRYVQTSELKNDVLMDENLLEMIREHPIFFRPHSKAVLSRAIHNDTEFLALQMVMDYSLLVGIDEAKSELVIGIIDFIRTFTWDKKLEMYVKSSGILGGQGRMPTVVSPELYRTRFTEAMHRYFLMVPDKWTGLGNDLD